jgi:hypothetical protein
MDNFEMIQAMVLYDSLQVDDLYRVTVDLSELSVSQIELIEQQGAFPLFKHNKFLFIALTDLKIVPYLEQALNIPIKAVKLCEKQVHDTLLGKRDIFPPYQYDAARIYHLLNGNEAAISLVKNSFLVRLNARVTDCYFNKIYNHFFKQWEFWRIGLAGCMPPEEMTFAALGQMAIPQEYDNLESGWHLLVAHEPIHILSEEEAISYTHCFIDFCATSVHPISPEDIEYESFYPLENDFTRWRKMIQNIPEFQVRRKKNGYTVFMWLIKQYDIYQGVFEINTQGLITSTLTLIEPNIAISSLDFPLS